MMLACACGGDDNLAVDANFKVNEQVIVAGQTITFTDLSAGNPVEWQWTFEGGTPAYASEQNPSVQYLKPGLYAVELFAANDVRADIERKEEYILVEEKLVAKFTASDTVINAGDQVSFSDASEGIPTNWRWEIPGGSPAISSQPTQTVFFPTPGFSLSR